MTNEEIIAEYLTDWTTEQLCALLAHAQDGKLSYGSCCCLIGIRSADHAYKSRLGNTNIFNTHYMRQRFSPRDKMAERAFRNLGLGLFEVEQQDAQRLAAIIPLIQKELHSRDVASVEEVTSEEVTTVSVPR